MGKAAAKGAAPAMKKAAAKGAVKKVEKLAIAGAKAQQALSKDLPSGGMAVIKKAAAVGCNVAAAEQAKKVHPTDKVQATLLAKRIYGALRRANKKAGKK